jgi:hypothetical protein
VTRVVAPTQKKHNQCEKKWEKQHEKNVIKKKKTKKNTTNAREATQKKKQHEKNIRKNRAQTFWTFFPSNPKKCLYLLANNFYFGTLKWHMTLKTEIKFYERTCPITPKKTNNDNWCLLIGSCWSFMDHGFKLCRYGVKSV